VDRAGSAVRPVTGVVDARRATEVGRRARLELTFSVRDGRTVLSHAYAEPPFRIGRCFQEGQGVHLILASSAPGIFGGDRFEQRIRVETGAVVRLVSQSALQLHPSSDGREAMLHSRYEVAAGAALSCTWDPLIPFAGASLEQRIELDVASDGRLAWSDATMSGREGREERWQFASLAHTLRLRCGGGLAYLERYRIVPESDDLSRPWVAGGGSYFGTMLRTGFGDDRGVAEAIHNAVLGVPEASGSADLLETDLLLVRLMAASGVAFHRARRAAADALGPVSADA
jgi:urease accessory protein